MENGKITADMEVSTSELACILGVSGRYIRQLAEDGQLKKTSKGGSNCAILFRNTSLPSPKRREKMKPV